MLLVRHRLTLTQIVAPVLGAAGNRVSISFKQDPPFYKIMQTTDSVTPVVPLSPPPHRYWLMKSEPSVYGLAHLERDGRTLWDGIRNYQARNYLRQMQVGDLAFFYHSNVQPPGIVGLMQIAAIGIPDPTQFDAASDYFDPKSTPGDPRWWTVEVAFVRAFDHLISLDRLRQTFTPETLAVTRRGNRLSVMPVDPEVAEQILALC